MKASKTMKKQILFITAALTFNVFLSSCSPTNERKKLTISASSIAKDPKLSSAEKAEELAKAAETLLTADGFIQAHQLAKKALSFDKQNLRAGLIKALIEPVLLARGIHMRVKPLAPNAAEYDIVLNEKRELARTSALERFLLDGKPEFTKETQFQDYLDQYTAAFDRLRIFARDHKNFEITLQASSLMAEKLNEIWAESCELVETPNFDYEVQCPEDRFRQQVSLNYADFEMLQHLSAFTLFMTAIYSSYDATGMKKIAKLKAKDPHLKTQAIYNELIKNPRFGILRKKQGLSNIKNLSLDVFAGMQWAMDNFASLCRTGDSSPMNRMGMLFPAGMCISGTMAPYLKEGIEFIHGTPQELTFSRGNETRRVLVSYMTLINKPVADVRMLGHLGFDNCGNIISAGDNSLGSMFPLKDANENLPFMQPVCDQP